LITGTTTKKGIGYMERALKLKKLVAVDQARFPAIAPLDIHKAMASAFDKAPTVGDRHFPEQARVKPGTRCVFLERVEKKGKSVQFHVYTYTHGLTPDQVVPDFTAAKADIKVVPIKRGGKQVEVVHRFACLVLGDAIVIEDARVYGAANLAVMAIRDLIRRHVNSKFPRLILEDAPSGSFKKMVKAHGGVVELTARLNFDFVPEKKSFGFALEQVVTRQNINKFKQLSANIKGSIAEPLDPDSVLKIVEESEDSSGLSGVSVVFGDGTSLSDLKNYRERHYITVQEVAPGRPAVTEIESGMVDYLKALITPSGQNIRIIDDSGIFVK
jgi:hypothetical protein